MQIFVSSKFSQNYVHEFAIWSDDDQKINCLIIITFHRKFDTNLLLDSRYSIWKRKKSTTLFLSLLTNSEFSFFESRTIQIDYSTLTIRLENKKNQSFFFYHFWQIQNLSSKAERYKLITRLWLLDSIIKILRKILFLNFNH